MNSQKFNTPQPKSDTSHFSSKGTPQSSRRYLNSSIGNHKIYQRPHHDVNSPSMNAIFEDGHSVNSENNANQIFWGTNISVQDIENKFTEFLKTFTDPTVMAEEGEIPVYCEQLEHLKLLDGFVLNVDAAHIFLFDKFLYAQLLYFPNEVIPTLDKVASRVFLEVAKPMYPRNIQLSLFNLKKSTRMRELGPKNMNHLISIKGLIIRSSEIIPDLKDAVFRCTKCNFSVSVEIERGKVKEPRSCPHCGQKETFSLIHNESKFIDKQLVKLQESPENVPEGETPMTITMLSYEDNVDSIKPGDRVEVVGIYRAQGMRIRPNQRTIRSLFRTYIDVVSFNKVKSSNDHDSQDLSPEEEQCILELSQDPNIYEKLLKSFAPGIYGLNDVKKGLLCQLFAGTHKDFSHIGRGVFRADINIILVGDPSTSKSQLLQHVHKLISRGIYTSGKGSSAVGLTAYVTKDPDTREIILESGALVLSDKGICCIDEFDKMDDDSKAILHEVMEQQTISIAKAGIVCQLNARAAILAAANPVDSCYNANKSVIENLKLPPSLISRFDLIYLMLDLADEKMDKHLAAHILNLYSKRPTEMEIENEELIPRDIFSKYIAYARLNCSPEITLEAEEELIKGYSDMRGLGSSKNIITATPRQLEGMIRISEAVAKMRLSTTVERVDILEALRLINVATRQAATDPRTGVIDMNMISTGVSSNSREKMMVLQEIIREILREKEEIMSRTGITKSQLREEIQKKSPKIVNSEDFPEAEYFEALRILEEENIVSLHGGKRQSIIKLQKIDKR